MKLHKNVINSVQDEREDEVGRQLVKKGVAYTGCRHGPELIPGERRRTAKEIKAASNRGYFYPAFLPSSSGCLRISSSFRFDQLLCRLYRA